MQFPVHLIPKKVAAYLNILKMGNTFFFFYASQDQKAQGLGWGWGYGEKGEMGSPKLTHCKPEKQL